MNQNILEDDSKNKPLLTLVNKLPEAINFSKIFLDVSTQYQVSFWVETW